MGRQVGLDVVVERREACLGVGGERAEPDFERFEVAEVAGPRAVARRLGRVRRPDPSPRRPDRRPAELGLPGAVDGLVEPEEQMRAVGERDAPLCRDAFLLEVVELVEEPREVDDDAVADDARCLLVEDARRDEVELVFFPGVVVDGVSGVGAALREMNE